MKEIVFVIVNYNTAEEVAEFIRQFQSLSGRWLPRFRVVIVENSTEYNSSLENIRDNSGGVIRYVKPVENLGYLNGLLYGYEYASTQWANLDRYVFCNSDLSFDAEYVLDWVAHQEIKNIGLIGPNIIAKHRAREQNPLYERRPSRSKLIRLIFTYSSSFTSTMHQNMYHLKTSIALPKRKRKEYSKEIKRRVYSVHGAFFVIGEAFIENSNVKAWPCFLYSEELFLAELARKNEYEVVFDPTLTVHHNEHVSTGTLTSKASNRWRVQSLRYCLDTFW